MQTPQSPQSTASHSDQRAAQRLSLINLEKSFGNVHVVKNLSLDIEPGEFLVLLGPSGCGKTTALRMIAGLETVDSGRIELGGRDITNVLPKYRDIAMVFQSYALYPHKTVAENIGFPLKVSGFKSDAVAAAVNDTAEQVHMVEYLDRYPRELSGGQRQRVALGRAMIRRPEAFLMDEPLSNLDAKLRGFMRAELKHMQHDLGTTTVYVTHDQIEAMTLAHRVAIMNNGVLQQLGTPTEVYDEPATLFVAGFMGSPPMNFVHGVIGNGQFSAGSVSLPVSGETSSGKAVLGFRPEHSEVCAPGEGLFDAKIFTVEQTGEYTLVTLVLGDDTMTIKMPRGYDGRIHDPVGVRFPLQQGFIFDEVSGEREPVKLQ